MLIACPTCATSYEIQLASLGETGRSVRCVRCRTVWFASPPSDEEAAVDATAVAEAPAVGEPAATAAGEGLPPDPEPAANADESAHGETDWGVPEQEPAREEEAQAEPVEQVIAPDDAPPLAPSEPHTIEADFEPATSRSGGKGPKRLPTGIRRKAQTAGRWTGLWRPDVASLGMPGLILVMVGLIAGLVLWRTEIVRALPQTASFYSILGLKVNLRGLAFEGVKVTKDTQDNMPVLVIEGAILNTSQKVLEVPRLRFAMRNESGEIYAWTALPERPTLSPGQSENFRTRLASPPAEGREVVVRFFGRRDLAGGLN